MNSAYHRLYRTLGINIAYYRNMKDMSQEQLGDRLEIDQSHVSKIERASIGISISPGDPFPLDFFFQFGYTGRDF